MIHENCDGRGPRPHPHLSGPDRGAARGIPHRGDGPAAPPPPDRAAGRGSDGPVDAGLDRAAKAAFLGCKIVTVFPDNAKLQRPSIYGSYMLMSGETGEPLAVMDGTALTAWRTACASALAASYLAREDAAHLVMIGAGALAPHLVARACERAADPARHAVEPHAQARRADGVRSFGRRARGRGQPTISRRRCATPTSSPARRSRRRRWCAASG